MLNNIAVSQFVSKVEAYSTSHNLFVKGEKYLVALSGGADSVALLRTMLLMGIDIEAAHCNFHLRGEESGRDEQFCKDLCEYLNVPLHLAHFDTREYSALHHVSIEMAARELRYSYFRSLLRDISAKGVCVAHHQDDCVETVIMNLVRGTGIHGLRGILPRNGEVLRPLLCVSRTEIENYLSDLSQDYVNDSTNFVDDVTRNKIRLDVLPILRQINPSVRNAIADTATNITEACRVFDDAVSSAISDVRHGDEVDVAKLLSTTSPEYVLFTILKEYSFSSAQVRTIYSYVAESDRQNGRVWSTKSHDLLYERGRLILQKRAIREFKEMILPEEGTYVIDEKRKLRLVRETKEADYQISKSSNCVCVDASELMFPLHLRHAIEGDRFFPFGMRGSKLLSDYLTDRKKNLFEKRSQLVLTTHDNRIVWVVNERVDNRFRIKDETTAVLRISLL